MAGRVAEIANRTEAEAVTSGSDGQRLPRRPFNVISAGIGEGLLLPGAPKNRPKEGRRFFDLK